MKKILSLASLASLALVLGGCASINDVLVATSAQHVPCSSKDISVVKDPGVGVWTWTATCQDKAYSCTGIPDGRMGIKNSSCKAAK